MHKPEPGHPDSNPILETRHEDTHQGQFRSRVFELDVGGRLGPLEGDGPDQLARLQRRLIQPLEEIGSSDVTMIGVNDRIQRQGGTGIARRRVVVSQ